MYRIEDAILLVFRRDRAMSLCYEMTDTPEVAYWVRIVQSYRSEPYNRGPVIGYCGVATGEEAKEGPLGEPPGP